jgi:glycyl-tRNA synthetase (class II)
MKCPVCSSFDSIDIGLHVEGFSEEIIHCKACGTVWSINHGLTEIVKDGQENSFLEAQSECVESDDYSFRNKK